MDYVNAFWVGGLICALAQILLDRTKLLPGRVMVLLVCLGAIISFFGWYEPFAEYAGAGANVPLLGYGNILMKGIKEAVDKDGFIGLFKGGFTNGAVGCSADIWISCQSHIQTQSKKGIVICLFYVSRSQLFEIQSGFGKKTADILIPQCIYTLIHDKGSKSSTGNTSHPSLVIADI